MDKQKDKSTLILQKNLTQKQFVKIEGRCVKRILGGAEGNRDEDVENEGDEQENLKMKQGSEKSINRGMERETGRTDLQRT